MELITCSAWRNSTHDTTEGIGIIVNIIANNAISSIDIISRIMAIHFQGDPHSPVISCYRPTNTSDELETDSIYSSIYGYIYGCTSIYTSLTRISQNTYYWWRLKFAPRKKLWTQIFIAQNYKSKRQYAT